MSTVPVRLDADALAAKDRLTEPEPVPEIGPVAVIHESIGVAVHGHPVDEAFTPRTPLPPAAGREIDDSESVKEQLLPNCVTVYAMPFTRILPVRTAGPGLGDAEKFTEPLPLPLPGKVTVSQFGKLAWSTDQLQEGGADTEKLPPAPEACTLLDVGLTA